MKGQPVARVDVRSIRRDQILAATERLAAQRGLAQTTFAEICREAEVSNGVLTYHFKDKDDLLLALLERVVQRWRSTLAPVADDDRSVSERLSALVTEAEFVGETDREAVLLLLHYLSEAVSHPEVGERLRGMFEAAHARNTAELAPDAACGAVCRSPAAAASVVQCVLLGVLIGKASLGIEAPPDDVAEMLLGYLTGEATRSASDEGSGRPGCLDATG